MLRLLRGPIRTVVRWQLIATTVLALAAAAAIGSDGAISAALGGLISMFAGLVSALVVSRVKAASAGGVLLGALRAEGIKIGLMVILLWLVLATYRDVVALALLGSFAVTMLIFTMAFIVREH
ncbi:MAG: ATP synthase subunit I [Burkholderiales bacterium]